MATFDDLVAEAAGGDLMRCVEYAQEGVTWEYYLPAFEVLDDMGEFSEVDMTGVTCEWKVLSKVNGGSVIATLTTSLTEDNQWKGVLEVTDDLADVYVNPARTLPWFCTLTNGGGRKVSVFGPHDSRLIIKQGD